MGTAASANSNSGGADNPRAVAEVTEGYIASDSITNWTANRVGVWLMNTCELGQYCEMFYTARINGAVLKDLTDEELEELGIHNRMHRKRIFTEICKQNDFELDELERSVGTPSPRQYWAAAGSPRSHNKNSLYAPSPRTQRRPQPDFQFSPRSSLRDSPKFTLGPTGTPRAWQKPKQLALGNDPNSRPGDVLAMTPKASPYKTVASVNLLEALDDVEAQQKRRHAKWYANKVVEKSLIAMRAALKTARGMAVLQAEARYHGSLEAARETLMHNTRLQARQKAIEDFYSGNWRHKGVSPMNKYAARGFKAEEQLEAAMKEEEDQRRRNLRRDREALDSDDDEGIGETQATTGADPEEKTPDQRIIATTSLIREKYAAPEGKQRYDGPGPGVRLNSNGDADDSPGRMLVDTLMRDAEEEDEEERLMFERAASKGLHLKQLITTKKEMLADARQRGDEIAVANLTRELAELEETGPANPAPKPPPRRSSRAIRPRKAEDEQPPPAPVRESKRRTVDTTNSKVATPLEDTLSPVSGDVQFLEQKKFSINDETVEDVLSTVEKLGSAGAAAKLHHASMHAPLEATESTASLYEVAPNRFDARSIQVKPANMSGIWARTEVLTKERGRVFFSTLNRCERALAARGSHFVSDISDLKNFKRTVASSSGEEKDPQTGSVDWEAARHFMVIQQQSHRVTMQQVSKGKLNTFTSVQVGDTENVPFIFYNELLHLKSKWISLEDGYSFCAKDRANMIQIPPLQGSSALLFTFKAAMKTGSLKQQKVLSMLLYINPGADDDPMEDVLHVMYSAVERSSLHLTFKRLPQEYLRPLRKQWKCKSREKYPFIKPMKEVLPRTVDEVDESTTQKIQDAKRIVGEGLVALGPTLTSVLIPSQAYDVILHDIAKNRFDILCDERTLLDSSELDVRQLNPELTLKGIRRELQTSLPDLTQELFQNVMDPIFQALNVTRHTQAAFHYLTSIFQDNLYLWFRPVASMQALLQACPNAMDDTELKVLGVAVDRESQHIYVQSKIPFELLLRDWCFPESSPERQFADNGWVPFLPLAAVVTEGISFADDEVSDDLNICVRLQTMQP